MDPAGDPQAPGTVKVQFPWDQVALGLLLGLAVLLIVRRIGRSSDGGWLRVHVPGPAAPKLMPGLSTGTHDPPKPAKVPPELPVMASEVEAGHAEPAGDADVTLKGSKIKEN